MKKRLFYLPLGKAIPIFLLFLLFCFQFVTAQVSYTQTWAATGLNSWTNTGAAGARTTTSICATTASVRANVYSGTPSWIFTSPSVGTSNGGLITMSYQYKIINWSGGAATPNTFGNFKVQYASAAAGPWTDVPSSTISTNHVASTSCVTKTVTFTPSTGALYVRFNATWAAGDYYLYFDEVAISQGAAPACLTPSSLTSSAITSSSATIGWTASPSAPASGYEIYYSTSATAPVAGTTPTATVGAGVTTYNITGLSANTTYYFWVRSNCGGAGTSAWAGSGTFFTGYCAVSGTNGTYYMSNFTTTGGITNLNNSTGYSAGGYGNYTAQSASQTAGSVVNFTSTFTGGGTMGFRIYIDWNNDLDFLDANENPTYGSGGYVASASGSFTVPAGTAVGNYRMRIVADYLSTTPISCGASTYLEAEDYTFSVVTPPACLGPTALVSSSITTSSATIGWTASASTPTGGYQIYYSTSATAPTAGTTPLATVGAGVTTYNITGLSANTTYYFWVRSNCGGAGTSAWAGSGTFFTGYCAVSGTNGTYYISNFTTTGGITNLNNTTGYSAGGYGNYTAQSVSQYVGSTVNFVTNLGGGGDMGLRIYIDWNNDLDFLDANENPTYGNNAYAFSPISGSFTVPAGTLGGNYRMRVVADYFSTTPIACGTSTYLEAEDYTFTVIVPPSTPPNPTNITASPTCASGVTLTATGTPPAGDTWYWQGTNPTGTDNSAGANATSNLTVFSNATYYIRAYNATTALWSTTSGSYNVTTVPANAATAPAIASSNGNPACVSTNISSPTALAGSYWQTTAAGTSTASPATTPYNGVTTGGTYYVRSLDGSGCWSAPSTLAVSVLPTIPTTLTVTQIPTCGGTTGTVTINSAYNNNFATANLGNMVLYGNASLTGGVLQLNPNALSQNGAAVIIDPSAVNTNAITVDFDLITLGAQGADGASYSFGDDVTVGLPANSECGSGTKLKLAFDAYTNGTNTPGVYLMYNCTTLSQAPSSPGVLAYSNNVSWCGGVTKHVTISIDNNGIATVSLGGAVLFSNIALGSGYTSANKSTWKHAFAARTGGVAQGHQVDNINIVYGAGLQFAFDNVPTWGASNTANLGVGSYPTWVSYTSNPTCQFSAGTATINPFAVTGGTAISSVPGVCSGTNFTLSLAGATTGGGATYQWQSSATGLAGSWSNIATATAATLTTSQTATTYYQCLVTCSGNTANSMAVQVQNIPCISMTNGSTVTCSANFFDSGGSGADYANSENFTYTISPSNPCDKIQVTFSSFAVESGWDYLKIYNGNNTTAPLLSNNTGTLALGTITSTAADGSLTFNFTSDGSAVLGGWAATVSCVAAPASPPAGVNATFCGTNVSVPLSATGAGTLNWYAASTGGPILGTGTTFTTAPISVATTYYVESVSSCGTSTRTAVTATPNCTINMPTTGSFTGCGFNFYDSGGSGAVYGNNEDRTITICPASPSDKIKATFTAFDTEASWDPLYVFNGNSASAAMFASVNGASSGGFPAGGYWGTAIPGPFTSTDATGCLTFRFRSDASGTPTGWAANITCVPPPPYVSLWGAVNTGAATWCAGETRTVTVVVQNNGTATWTSSTGNNVNFSYWWSNQNHDSNPRVLPFTSLAPGQQQTVTMSITAPSATGTYSLNFDIVKELDCWFSDNNGSCGPGNIIKTVSSIIVNPNPVVNAGLDVAICPGGNTTLNGSATVTPATTTLHTANSAADFSTFTTNDATRWAYNTSALAGGTAPELVFSYVTTATVQSAVQSPLINATGTNTINLSFKHMVDWFTASFNLKLQTSPDGITWTDRWTVSPTASIAAATVNVNLNAVAGSSFYYRFLFDGNTWNINNWYIDDIAMTATYPYIYAWTPSATLSNASILNPIASPSGATTYTLTTTVAGCSSTDQVDVSISNVVASISSQTNVSCFGGNNGDVTVVGTGGTSPYTYQLGTGAFQGNGFFSGLAVGTYTVTAKDANNCISSVSVVITEPATAVGGTVSIQNVSCFGGSNGSITVTGTNGTPLYTFKIDAGAYTSTSTASNTFVGLSAGSYAITIKDLNNCTVSSTETVTEPATGVTASSSSTPISCNGGNSTVTVGASGGTAPYTGTGTFTVTAGSYTYNITDNNGCPATTSITVAEPAVLSANILGTDVPCFGNSTGAADLSVSGGTMPYAYSWNNGTLTEDLTAIAAGNYNVTVTDAHNCTTTANVTIAQPTAGLSANISGTNVLCFGNSTGAADLSVSGGTMPYTYSWNNGTLTEDLTAIAAGNYDVTVTDAHSCTTTANVTITQPTGGLSANISGTDVLCFGNSTGAADLNVTGGTSPYSYSWNNGTLTEDLTAIAAGNYDVTVTDFGNCTTTANVTIGQPSAALSANIAGTDVLCFGNSTGAADLSVSGGTMPYTYSWNNGTLTADLTAIAAGNYDVTVTDAHSCSTTANVTIAQPTAGLSANISGTNVLCFGNSTGAADLSVSGGTMPYAYSWNNGTLTEDLTAIAAGNYDVTVTDAHSCTTTANVTITQPTGGLSANISGTDVLCFGNSTGAADLSVSGGTMPYAYSWNNGTLTEDLTAIAAGNYDVTVTDFGNCTTTANVTIGQPSVALSANIAGTDVLCFGNNTGAADLSVSGGTTPYSYSWNNGTLTEDLTGLVAGNYDVTVTDAHSCSTTANVTIAQPTAGLSANISGTNVLCFGNNTGAADLSVSGGTSPYAYSWNNGTLTEDLTAIAAGNYDVTVTDAHSCTTTANVTITQPTGGLSANIVGTDVLCFGNSTGAADLNVTGGTTPYSYSWNNGTLTEDLTAIAAGNYDVTVTDFANCTTTANVTIGQPSAALSANIAGTDVLCFGNSTGAADLSVSGGTSPYTYSWNNGTLTEDLTAIAAGNYDVTVTDAHNCTTTANVTIAQPTTGLSANISGTNVLCFGNSTGAADLSVSGGTMPYAYSWNNGTLTEDLTAIAAGNYDVTVTDAHSCTTTANVTITQPTGGLSANISGTDVLCFGNSTGAADLNVIGGTSPYTYSWNNGTLSEDLAGLSAGNYDVTVTDFGNCTTTANVTIGQPSAALSANIAGTDVLCFGNSTGAADLSVSGGTSPYSYSWNNGTLTEDLTAIAAGNYDVTVTDAHSCSTTANVTIAQPSAGLSANISGTNVLCFGNITGAADLSVSGGTMPYAYSWNNGTLSEDLTAIAAGNYDVTVTDAHSCTTTANVTITQPTGGLSANIVGTDVLCFGNSTGAADLNVTGGTTPYSYSWNNGTLSEDLTAIAAGNYDVTVTDFANCTTTANVTIAEPSAALSANIAGTDVLCFGNNTGAADLSVTGGTSPYTYSWNNGTLTEDLTAIAAGNYDVTVTDFGNCTTTANVTIAQPTAGLSANISGTNVLCFGNNTGAADLSVSGGTMPYAYSWNNGTLTEDLTAIVAGNYDVTVTDAHSCTTTANVTITQPTGGLSAIISGTDVLCFGNSTGAADLNVTGGTTPYSYSWNNGATSQDLTGIAAGNYDVTVTDFGNCTTTANVTIGQPSAALSANIAGTDVLCFGNSTGAADLSVSGGTSPYTYSWNNGTLTEDLTAIAAGNYDVTVTDAHNCSTTANVTIAQPTTGLSANISGTNVLCFGNSTGAADLSVSGGTMPYAYSWNNGTLTEDLTAIAAGNYDVTVTDAHNCSTTANVTITQPTGGLSAIISGTDVLCFGNSTGAADLSVTGGTTPYSYSWNNGILTEDLTGIAAGNYNVTVTDFANCTTTANVTIAEPSVALSANIAGTDVLCFGNSTGAADLSVSGGTSPYTYSWNNGTLTEDLTGLAAGNYDVTVTDAHSCSTTANVTIAQPTAGLSANISGTNVLCFGNNTGAADLSVSGGTMPYAYSWNNGTLTEDLTAIAAGNYDVTVTDAHSCTTTANVTITQPTGGLSANIVGTDVLCFGNSTGAADLNVTGGTTPYSYSWNNGILTEDLTGIAAGNYNVTVTDFANCTTTANVTIAEPSAALSANIAGTDVLCFGNSTGAADLSVSGGTSPYTYSWNNGTLTEDLTAIAAGNYDVTVTDAHSCSTTANVTIAQPTAGLSANISGTNVLCFGNSTGAADLSVSGGTMPYAYSWNNGTLTEDLTAIAAGNYDVTVTDAHNCSTTANVTITQPTGGLSANIVGTDVLCFGNSTGAADLNVTGGTSPYTYSWNNGTLSEDLAGLSAGNYDVTVTDFGNCTTTANVTIGQPTAVLSANIAETDVLCFGNSTGAADLSVTGGTTPYAYSWNNGTLSEDLTAIAAGNYDVTVTDAHSCTTTANVTITQPTGGLSAIISGTDVLCFGNSTGAADLNVTGGTMPYAYSWNNGTLTEDLTAIAAGNYDVTVTDAHSCTTTANVTITQPTGGLSAIISGTDVLCFGNSTGAADLSVSGGTAPYTYSWNNGTLLEDLTGIAAGNYNVTVTDFGNCTTTANVTIGQPTAVLSANIAETDVLCFGNSTGAADLSVSGGTMPYTYSWNNGILTEDLTAIAAGNYDVTVTDAHSCSTTANVTIAQPTAGLSANISGTNVLCFGNSTGAADLSVSGGTSPYAYSWNNGTLIEDLTAIAAGNYDVTVTDAHNCSTTANVTITQPTGGLSANISGTDVLCFGNSTGAADLNVTGGTTPYSYSWNNGTLSEDLTAIAAGNYDVTVTDFANCTTTANVTIAEPSAALSANIAGTDVLCFGNSTGAADLSVSGGTSPYTYSWNNGTLTEDLTAIAAGNYDVTVTDAHNCTTTANVTIAQPTAGLSANISGTNVLCFGNNTGAADLSVSGGTMPYAYSWNNGTLTEDLTAIAAGNYDVTVTDLHNCTTTANVTITQPAVGPSVNPIANVSLCPGQPIVFNFSGSLVPSTVYEWTVSNTAVGLAAMGSGDINTNAALVSGTSQVATITVTPNAAGCLGASETAQITILPKPAAPVVGVTPYCSDATIWVSSPVSGTINWYDVSNNFVGTGVNVPNITTNGNYYAYEDLSGCVSDISSAAVVYVGLNTHWTTIASPTPPVNSTHVYYADAFCLDGSTGLKYYYNTGASMLLMASDYSIPAGVQLVGHTPTNSSEMAVKVDVLSGYGSGQGQFVSADSGATYVTSPYGWYVMHRTWQIEVHPSNQIPVGDSVRVKFFFSDLDEYDIFNSTGTMPDSFRFYKLQSGLDPSSPVNHNGVDSTEVTIYDPSTIPSLSSWSLGIEAVTNQKTADYYVNSFSGGGGGAGPNPYINPLPVVITLFKGENVGNENLLHWTTEKELNTNYFDVERSSDTITYHKIGQVVANGSQKYDFTDSNPLIGSNHYRLKVVDNNGAFNHSKSIELKYIPANFAFAIYPNPMIDKLNVAVEGLPKDSKVRFSIYNAAGQKVFSELWKEQGNILKEVNVSSFSQGTYFYECVELKSGEAVKGKLTKTD